METRYLNAYLKHIDKIKVFEDRLVALSSMYPELKKISETPSTIPTNIPTIITAEYLNTLFMYYYSSLYYLNGLSGKALNDYCLELEFIESRISELKKKIEDTRLLARKAKAGAKESYNHLKFEGDLTLKKHRDIPIHTTYLDINRVSSSYPCLTEAEYISGIRVENKSDLEFAFDNDPLSIWCDYVISHAPITSIMDGNESRGALLKVTVSFETVVPINRMAIYPISGYPMSLKKTTFWYGDQELIVADAPKFDYLPDGRMEFRFSTVSADKIEIIFEQEHSIVSDDIKKLQYISDKVNNALISTKEAPYTSIKGLIETELNRIFSVDPSFVNMMAQKLEITRDSTELETSKYREYIYVFGARSIEFYYTTYKSDSVISTPKYDLDSNIYSISLDTIDTFENGHIITYYLKLGNGIEIPIIPTNHDNTVRERLYFANHIATTTFPVVGNITVLQNDGPPIGYTSEALEDGRLAITLIDDSAVTRDIFHCIYTSDDNRSEIVIGDYILNPVYIEEEINVVSDTAIKLSYVPFIYTEIINDTDLFTRRDDSNAIYDYISSDFYEVGNITFGQYSTGYVYLSSDDTKFYSSVALTPDDFPTTPYITVGDYTWSVEVTSDGFITTAASLSAYYTSDQQYSFIIGSSPNGPVMTYEPVIIEIDGLPAQNITSYETPEIAMFNSNSINQFVASGKNVYFNKKPTGSLVAKYYTKCGFLQVEAVMSRRNVLDASETPCIKDISVTIKPRI